MFFKNKRRPLTALQVEVTTRCTRSCAICPRHALSDRWIEGDLSETLWGRIRPHLSVARHVHLQSWGEPLLHPNLPQMARDIKKAACSVGLTTNGDLLDDAIPWIVRERIDQVAVTVAGETEHHAAFRDGAAVDSLLQTVENLARRIRTEKGPTRLQIAYLLTRANAPDLPSMVTRVAECGVNELYVIHLDVTPDQSVYDQAAFDEKGLRPGVAGELDEAEQRAQKQGLPFRGPARFPDELLVCGSNPPRIAVIGWEGKVGPCVNLMIPIQGSLPRWTPQGRCEVRPVHFGSLLDQSLPEILESSTRRDFLESFQKRLEAEQAFRSSVMNVSAFEALRKMEPADQIRSAALGRAPFPDPCRGCHKQRGW